MKKKVSIIIPFFNEKENIPIILSELELVIIKLKESYDFEILLMDNGSNDGSSDIAKKELNKFPNSKYFKMSRNFGYQANIKAGYDLCTGDAAVVLDSDGEDDPNLIINFLQSWKEGFDVVYGIRKKRQESKVMSFIRNIFYSFLEKFSELKLPRGAGDFRLIDRKVINKIKQVEEKNLYLRGLISFIGYKQKGIEYDRRKRFKGNSKISILKYFDISFSAITSFTKTPLILIFIIGIIILLFSVFLMIFYLILFLTDKVGSPGFTTIILVQLFFFGLFTLMLGIISIYVGYVLDEVKKRPTYIIENEKKDN